MGTTVCSLLWLMHDLYYHQPYQPRIKQALDRASLQLNKQLTPLGCGTWPAYHEVTEASCCPLWPLLDLEWCGNKGVGARHFLLLCQLHNHVGGWARVVAFKV